MYLNRALIAGNLTRDPELRSLPTGAKVATFSVATNRYWRDQNGKRRESTDYHNIVVFGNHAENSARWLKKGSQVLIEGRLQTRSWDAPGGQKRYRTEIVADRVQFGNASPSADTKKESDSSTDTPKETPPVTETPHVDLDPLEDIPF